VIRKEVNRMSYSLFTPCFNCVKKDECKDGEKISKAVEHIHLDNDGTHKGCGQIVMACVKHEEITES
jgi:hypothetical protein